jgi:urease accessory protein
MADNTRALLRSSPRKRGPAPAARKPTARQGKFRGQRHERGDRAEPVEPAALFRLMTWLSPAYPVGAFAYSGGIEWAVEAGDIGDAATLRQWLEAVLAEGAASSDGIFFVQAYRAVADGNSARVAEIAELAAAFSPTRERYLETTTLGRTFTEVTCAAWPCPALHKLQQIWDGPPAYPVAVAAACAGHNVPLAPALHAFFTALASNLISAGVRLIPLGHTNSQRVLNAIEPSIGAAAQRALAGTLDDCASVTFRADIASARHETQYTRLFRS